MIGRRAVMTGAVALGTLGAGPTWAAAKAAEDRLAALEKTSGAGSGCRSSMSRGAVASAIASTSVSRCARPSNCWLLAWSSPASTAALKRLDRRVSYGPGDLVTYSPVTGKHVAEGLTVAELCEAALTLSDNTAGNLLLDSFGGPPAIGGFARTLGDRVTRLDRRETELNEARARRSARHHQPRRHGRELAQAGAGQGALARIARPPDWLVDRQQNGGRTPSRRRGQNMAVADKTGSGENGTTNDVAVMWPPGHGPLIVVAYLTGATINGSARNAVLSEIGRIAAGAA